LESIKNQIGHFGMEIVWINDGSDELYTTLLSMELKKLKETTRFIKIKYTKNDKNKGISFSLHKGIKLCSHEIIIKMDSDDIMLPNRIQTQLAFMKEYPDCVMCGSNIQMFKNTNTPEHFLQKTNHLPKITWDDYKLSKSHWIMNHPTLCYKKSAILSVGSYNKKRGSMSEDLELELKVLKKYGILYNIEECLVHYRIHEDQTTFNGNSMKVNHIEIRNAFIEELLKEDT
jgi:glycosyltransferase involved in cell wall biosynthesis